MKSRALERDIEVSFVEEMKELILLAYGKHTEAI
jgi:hypothetical protein